MGILDTEEGKKRILCVELPAIEKYNQGRDPFFRICVRRQNGGFYLRYRLKPMHNIYQLETRLPALYPIISPETRVRTPLQSCPHLLSNQLLCLWRPGTHRKDNHWDPARFTSVFAVLAAWRWLACYEIWLQTAEWPLPDAI